MNTEQRSIENEERITRLEDAFYGSDGQKGMMDKLDEMYEIFHGTKTSAFLNIGAAQGGGGTTTARRRPNTLITFNW